MEIVGIAGLNKIEWHWKPKVGIGPLRFGQKLDKELKKDLGLENAKKDEDEYDFFITKYGDISVTLENYKITSVEVSNCILYYNNNIIGMHYKYVKNLIRGIWETKILYEELMVTNDQLAITLWVEEEIVTSVTVQGEDEE